MQSAAFVTSPIVWHNFFSENDLTWNLLRGRMGYRRGDLIVKGDGNTPVILAPREPAIAWDLYQAVEIRMLAEGGREIKIKIGDREFKQKLGPPREYKTYRFDIDLETGAGVQPFLIMPTDGLDDLVAISSITLTPRKQEFLEPTGRRMIGKQEEYRNTLFVRSPSSLAYSLRVPASAQLHFGLGVAQKGRVTFRVLADGTAVYSNTAADPQTWVDAGVDLSSWAGREIKLTFETRSESPGAVAFWANPLLAGNSAPKRPNVLIYMIDTLRPDHASLYGYGRETTPYLKKFGAQAAVFDDCQVQATWTKPSAASLMTSLYSFTHGIRRDDDTIPGGAATLAERLRAAGYVTASIIANPLAGRLSGLQRGFDYVSEWQAVARRIREPEDAATDSAAVNRVLLPWLEQHRNEPFFVYAHATDPHAPYRAPKAFEEKFADPAETPEFDRDFTKLRKMALRLGGGFAVSRALCLKGGIDPDRFNRRAFERYDAKILRNDASFEQLRAKLQDLRILENTLVIVVSDHGEEFWEHGWTGHGQSLYEELARGVLLISNPKLIAPRRISAPVQLIDVMPTVLDLLGLAIPAAVEGQSLEPLLKGRPFQRRGPVVTSRFAHPYSQHDELAPENHIDSFALLDANWKLIYREKAKQAGMNRVELYDRRADRGDTQDVAGTNPRQVDRMMTELGGWIDAQKRIRSTLGGSGKAAVDRRTLDRLRTLGYLGGQR